MGYFKTQVSVFLNSWKRLGWNLIPIIAFDMLAIVIIALIGMFFLTIAASKAGFLPNAANIQNLPLEEATQFAQDLKGFILFFVILLVALLLFAILVWSFFKSLSWSVVVDKELNRKANEKVKRVLSRLNISKSLALVVAALVVFVLAWLSLVTSKVYAWITLGILSFLAVGIASQSFSLKAFKAFLIANLIWFIGWLVILILFVVGVKQEAQLYGAIPLFLIIIHSSFVLYTLLAKRLKWNVFGETAKTAVKVHYFIIPIIVILAIYFAYNLVWSFFINDPGKFLLINVIITTLYLAWSKIYYANMVEAIA
ncbi:MAG TPA: hypothetical protein VJI46_05730 [Candidatus Nanoarchaeia archaeon]|nr:hypothetical protein [Candidatus Nanoarchaeia archaeon]